MKALGLVLLSLLTGCSLGFKHTLHNFYPGVHATAHMLDISKCHDTPDGGWDCDKVHFNPHTIPAHPDEH